MEKYQEQLSEMEEYALRHSLPIIGPGKGDILFDLIKKYNPTHILEVGTLIGYSAIIMASAQMQKGNILTIEKNPEFVKIAQENINKAGLEKKVRIITGDAVEIIPQLTGLYDFLFLDADKKQYLDYLQLAEPLLDIDTAIVADNIKIFKEDVSNYLQYLRGSNFYNTATLDVGNDAFEVTEIDPLGRRITSNNR